MTHEPTDEQRAITAFVKNQPGNLVIDALAGSGKTFSLLEALKVIPQRSILLTAFNRAIADNLLAKLPRLAKTHAVHVKTFHALGFSMIQSARPDLKLEKTATEDLVNRVCVGKALNFNQRRWTVRLVKLCKETFSGPQIEPEEILELGFEHDVFGAKANEDQIETVIERVLDCYEASQRLDELTAIDFCDMVWLPVVLQMQPSSRYQAIMIDEIQDISEPQFNLLRRVMLPTTRLIAVGDRWQAVYGWRSGLGDRAWAIMQGEFNAHRLPLTTTFRCAQEIVEQANQLVPELRALPDNTGGTVTQIALADLPNHFVGGLRDDGIHTFVLSRRNDDLLETAIFLHKNRVKFQLAGGKELLAPLFELLDWVLDLGSRDRFQASLEAWKKKELARADKLDSPSIADRTDQHYAMLVRCAREANSPTMIKGLLSALLATNRTGVLLSTVHKVKGLEADRVFLIKNSFGRHRKMTVKLPDGRVVQLGDNIEYADPVDQEELNIEYVAITRAKWHLVWVDLHSDAEVTVDAAIDGLTQLGRDSLKKSSVNELEIMFARAEREGQRALSDDDAAAEHWFKYAKEVLAELSSRK